MRCDGSCLRRTLFSKSSFFSIENFSGHFHTRRSSDKHCEREGGDSRIHYPCFLCLQAWDSVTWERSSNLTLVEKSFCWVSQDFWDLGHSMAVALHWKLKEKLKVRFERNFVVYSRKFSSERLNLASSKIKDSRLRHGVIKIYKESIKKSSIYFFIEQKVHLQLLLCLDYKSMKAHSIAA